MKKLMIIAALLGFAVACGGNEQKAEQKAEEKQECATIETIETSTAVKAEVVEEVAAPVEEQKATLDIPSTQTKNGPKELKTEVANDDVKVTYKDRDLGKTSNTGMAVTASDGTTTKGNLKAAEGGVKVQVKK